MSGIRFAGPSRRSGAGMTFATATRGYSPGMGHGQREDDAGKRARRSKHDERDEPARERAAFLRKVNAELDANDRGPDGEYPGWAGTRSFPAPNPVLDAWNEVYGRDADRRSESAGG